MTAERRKAGNGLHEQDCACGRQAVELLNVASEDGLLMVPVCEECSDPAIGAVEDQLDLFGRDERRPLSAMPSRDDDRQAPLPLDEPGEAHQESDAA